MADVDSFERYDGVAKAFHWSIAALIVAVFGLAWYMDALPLGPLKADMYNLHKSIGLTILALAVLRLAWRMTHRPPPLPLDTPGWERLGAHAGHAALYVFLFLQPLLGLGIAFYSSFPTRIYGLFNLPSPVAPNKAVMDFMAETHELVGTLLLVTVGVHVAAALRHHFILKNNILRRMLPGAR
jgi:cytochrome b561